MAGQVTQQQRSIFQRLLNTVDNAGARAALSHVWDVLEEALGVAVPVVEAAVPSAAPVINAAEQTVESIDAEIQKLLAAKAQKMAASTPATPPAATPTTAS